MSATENSVKVSVTVTVNVPESRIADLLCSAWEGGSGYWIREVSGRPYQWDKASDPMTLALPVTVTEDEDDSGETAGNVHTLDMDAVRRGLQLMAERWPRHFANFMSEDDDAETGDVFLQLCLLGDIVYG